MDASGAAGAHSITCFEIKDQITVLHLSQVEPSAVDTPFLCEALDETHAAADERLLPRYSYSWQHLNRGRYAELALLNGRMECPDPRDGRVLQSLRSWVLPGAWVGIAYEFAGVDRFILVTSSFDQAKLGIWFPESGLFVVGALDPPWIDIATETVQRLKTLLQTVVPKPAEGERTRSLARIDLYLGFSNNLGHFMWHDLSGIEAVVATGSQHSLRRLVLGPHQFFPVASIFPELEAAGVEVCALPNPLPEFIEHTDSTALRVTGNRISRDLRGRIVAWALRDCGLLEQLKEFNDDSFNLWFNLRLHNKAWADQVAGIERIARTLGGLLQSNRRLRVILDGLPDTHSLAEVLKDRLTGVAQVVNATRVSLSQSIALAALVDLHVCAVGSGLTIAHWLVGRRGVAHSNRAHLNQKVFWNSVSEGAHDVSFIPNSAVTEHDGPTTPDASYVNYDFSVELLLEELIKLCEMHDCAPRISGVAQMLRLADRVEWRRAAERVISV